MDTITDFAKRSFKGSAGSSFSDLLDKAKASINWGGMKKAIVEAVQTEQAIRRNRNGFTPKGAIKHADFLRKLDNAPGYPKGAPVKLPPSCFSDKQMVALAEQSKAKAQVKRERKAKRRATVARQAAQNYYRMKGEWQFNPQHPFERELV